MTARHAVERLDWTRWTPGREVRINGDGIACETLPGAPSEEPSAEPAAEPTSKPSEPAKATDDTSGGGLPKTGGGDQTPILAAFGAFLLFAGAATVLGVRRFRDR